MAERSVVVVMENVVEGVRYGFPFPVANYCRW